MRRKLFTLVAGASAVAFVGVCVLWVRSCSVCDFLLYDATGYGVDLTVGRGAAEVYWYTVDSMFEQEYWGDGWRHRVRTASVFRPNWRVAGFWYAHDSIRSMRAWSVQLPLWFIASLLAVIPVRWCVSVRRKRQRMRSGFCLVCGFDLRATPDRCPECGTPVVAKREPIAPRPPAR